MQAEEGLLDGPALKAQESDKEPSKVKQRREELPIFRYRTQLLDAIRDNQVLIVCAGDHADSISAQITQYLAEEGFTNYGIVGCTKGRSGAVLSVVNTVAEEIDCSGSVGYSLPFQDATSSLTKIKFLKDSVLLKECISDKDLSNYCALIIDDCQERTIYTDMLLAVVKQILPRRPDFKLILGSASINVAFLSEFFGGCPIFTIPSTLYPVEIFYTSQPESSYFEAAILTVLQLHLTQPPGDILVFLPLEDFTDACLQLQSKVTSLGMAIPKLVVVAYNRNDRSEQRRKVFEAAPEGSRKCVFTSELVDVEGVSYVIDSGYVREKAFNAQTEKDEYSVVQVSQPYANLRAAKAGHAAPGKCFRLYTMQNTLTPSSAPEIQRLDLARCVLLLKAMGVSDVQTFPFYDAPSSNALSASVERLQKLGAVDSDGAITRQGELMAIFPLHPSLSSMLVKSVDSGCSEDMLTIVSMLYVRNIWQYPKELESQAQKQQEKFKHESGEGQTWLRVYKAWEAEGFSTTWCTENYVNSDSMKRAQKIRNYVRQQMLKANMTIVSSTDSEKDIKVTEQPKEEVSSSVIDFYTAKSTFPAFNGWKISILLEELGIPYRAIPLDLDKLEHKQPEFLKINPNGRIPAIVDHSNDGFSVFESGAIMLYLTERFGKEAESKDELHTPPLYDVKGRYDIMQWLMFQISGIGPMQGQAHAFYRYVPEKIEYAIQRYQNETRRLYEVLNARLSEHPYLANDKYSIADISCYPWVAYHQWAGVSLDGLDHLKGWLERLQQRPAVKKGLLIPDGQGKDIETLLRNAEEIQKKVAATTLDKVKEK